MTLFTLAATAAVVTLPVAAAGVGLAIWLGLVRARRAEARLRAVEELLRARVLPYLERRANQVGGGVSGRTPAVILGPDGSLVVTGEMSVAQEVGRLVGHIESHEDTRGALATSDTQQVADATTGPRKA
ncbi:MAG TPA: hypothetical protein VG389_08300 [Myxococcota bacterium]|jgi:hypothetical protein|nr:hypothetical protein [Myxococcota bacterium]